MVEPKPLDQGKWLYLFASVPAQAAEAFLRAMQAVGRRVGIDVKEPIALASSL